MSYQAYRSMHPYQLYTNDPVSKTTEQTRGVRESYAPTRTGIEPSPRLWLSRFWRTIHVMACTYSPTSNKVRDSYKCFYQSMANILPTVEARGIMLEFLHMPKSVQETLSEDKTLTTFFAVYGEDRLYGQVQTRLLQSPSTFFVTSLRDDHTLFAWTYLFHAYYNLRTGSQVETLHFLETTYSRSQVTKDVWGNPLWALIHFCAYYAPAIPDKSWKLSFKAFISCLMIALPCSMCRANLEQNLTTLDIDQYLTTREGVFEYTVELHNMVNLETKKPPLTIEEAKRIYAPQDQAIMRQNSYNR